MKESERKKDFGTTETVCSYYCFAIVLVLLPLPSRSLRYQTDPRLNPRSALLLSEEEPREGPGPSVPRIHHSERAE